MLDHASQSARLGAAERYEPLDRGAVQLPTHPHGGLCRPRRPRLTERSRLQVNVGGNRVVGRVPQGGLQRRHRIQYVGLVGKRGTGQETARGVRPIRQQVRLPDRRPSSRRTRRRRRGRAALRACRRSKIPTHGPLPPAPPPAPARRRRRTPTTAPPQLPRRREPMVDPVVLVVAARTTTPHARRRMESRPLLAQQHQHQPGQPHAEPLGRDGPQRAPTPLANTLLQSTSRLHAVLLPARLYQLAATVLLRSDDDRLALNHGLAALSAASEHARGAAVQHESRLRRLRRRRWGRRRLASDARLRDDDVAIIAADLAVRGHRAEPRRHRLDVGLKLAKAASKHLSQLPSISGFRQSLSLGRAGALLQLSSWAGTRDSIFDAPTTRFDDFDGKCSHSNGHGRSSSSSPYINKPTIFLSFPLFL